MTQSPQYVYHEGSGSVTIEKSTYSPDTNDNFFTVTFNAMSIRNKLAKYYKIQIYSDNMIIEEYIEEVFGQDLIIEKHYNLYDYFQNNELSEHNFSAVVYPLLDNKLPTKVFFASELTTYLCNLSISLEEVDNEGQTDILCTTSNGHSPYEYIWNIDGEITTVGPTESETDVFEDLDSEAESVICTVRDSQGCEDQERLLYEAIPDPDPPPPTFKSVIFYGRHGQRKTINNFAYNFTEIFGLEYNEEKQKFEQIFFKYYENKDLVKQPLIDSQGRVIFALNSIDGSENSKIYCFNYYDDSVELWSNGQIKEKLVELCIDDNDDIIVTSKAGYIRKIKGDGSASIEAESKNITHTYDNYLGIDGSDIYLANHGKFSSGKTEGNFHLLNQNGDKFNRIKVKSNQEVFAYFAKNNTYLFNPTEQNEFTRIIEKPISILNSQNIKEEYALITSTGQLRSTEQCYRLLLKGNKLAYMFSPQQDEAGVAGIFDWSTFDPQSTKENAVVPVKDLVSIEGVNFTRGMCASENYIYASSFSKKNNLAKITQVNPIDGTKVNSWDIGSYDPIIHMSYITHLNILIFQTRHNMFYKKLDENEEQIGAGAIIFQPKGIQYKYQPISPVAILRGGETTLGENDSWKTYGRDLTRSASTVPI